jgi:lipid A 3-O-deacylase
MKIQLLALPILLAIPFSPSFGQGKPATGNTAPASAVLATDPWEYGVFFGAGFGVGDRSSFSFTNAGVRAGKVLTDPHGPSFLRGQFEYAAEVLPYWQSFTPAASTRETRYSFNGQPGNLPLPYNGGTFTGISITPIILRWDLTPTRRFAPYLQGAGGLLWTNHKYPPDVIVPEGVPGGTSVWNFTPQGGVGVHYFLRDRQALDFQVSAVHISSASLGDRNPGVNASIQFQIGYSWWH